VARERPSIHRLARDAEALGKALGTLAAVQLDRVDAIEELRVRIHRGQHVAALFDDAVHVHAVFDRRDAEVRHAVEAAGDEDVAEPGLDLHRGDVDRHHRGGARAFEAHADHVVREAREEGDGRARMRLLAHHLDRAEQHAVDLRRRNRRAAEELLERGHGEVVGAHRPEDAAPRIGPSERRSNISDEDRVSAHERSSYETSAHRARRKCPIGRRLGPRSRTRNGKSRVPA
jgi:hypothetical protein